ncbi:MAG: DnaD domain protein [bacterium]|nr:DnaD domain protein [bacterium]
MNTILPADTYMVVNKTIINESDRKLITMLYQPIIGYSAVSMYFTLIDDLLKKDIMSEEQTHHHLMSTMQLKLTDIVIAREKLEAVGLLKTYLKKEHINTYVYVLYSPMTASEFFSHPVLNVVLYNNLGKKEYDKLVNCFKIPRVNLRDYEDITKKFNEVFSSISGNVFIENDNIVNRSKNDISFSNNVDFDMIISSIPKSMVNDKCFNEEIKGLIRSLAFIYNIDSLNMQGLVRNALNERGLIDKTILRKSCRDFYQFEEGGKLPTLIYTKQPDYLKSPMGDTSNWAKQVYTFENITPYDYLRSKYKSGEPTIRELKIIEDLMINFKMKPGVVNVLIAYVLKVNNQKFTKNYVETVASQWSRLNIETVEEAMRTAEKEHKKIKKLTEKKNNTKSNNKKIKEESVPSWFDKDLETEELSKEEQEELDNLLKEFI